MLKPARVTPVPQPGGGAGTAGEWPPGIAIQRRPVHAPLGTGLRLGRGPLGSGGVGDAVGSYTGVAWRGRGVGVGVGVDDGAVQRAGRLGVEVAAGLLAELLAELLGDACADGAACTVDGGDGLRDSVVHAVADSTINTTAARPNDPHLRPLAEPFPAPWHPLTLSRPIGSGMDATLELMVTGDVQRSAPRQHPTPNPRDGPCSRRFRETTTRSPCIGASATSLRRRSWPTGPDPE